MTEQWYLAEVLEEIHLEDEDTSLLWVNYKLVSADHAEQAYTKALQFGQEVNTDYLNAEGVRIICTFRGLRDLHKIPDTLADGAEIFCEHQKNVSEADIEGKLSSKEGLAVFQLPSRRSNRHWYYAEMVEALQIASEALRSLNIRWILVNADNREEAYAKALQFGQKLNREYLTPDGTRGICAFRGLYDLLEIYEEFEDGSEIVYAEYEAISTDDIQKMAKPKDELAVFRST